MEIKGKQKEKFKTDIKTKDFYNHYLDYYIREDKKIDKDSLYYIPYNTYSEVLDEVNSHIRDLILNERFNFIMPHRMGELEIKKTKPEPYIDEEGKLVNTLPIDWKATKDLWQSNSEAKANKKLVRHLNKHTQGYVARVCYNVAQATYSYKKVYKFIPTRTLVRTLASIMKDPDSKIDYYLK